MTRLVILMYHMVCNPQTEKEARYACPPHRFAQHMKLLAHGPYNVIGMDQVQNFCAGKRSLPENSVVITFDDGFRDNYEQGLPILQQHKFPATLFLTTGMVSGSNLWMSGEYPNRPMLNWNQIIEMQKYGVSIGGHTVNHVRLPQLSDDEANREIIDCKTTIEDKLGIPCLFFAYPYGLYDERHAKAISQAGYELACSTRSGFNTPGTDPFKLRRLEIYGTDLRQHLKRKIKFGANDGRLSTEIIYYVRRLKTRWNCR
jgi:peptidoglycan/xylan/chitin deacetylase (PgdA/CDA1 family)